MVLCVLLIWFEPVISLGAQIVTGKSVLTQIAVNLVIGLVGVGAMWARVTFQTTLNQKIAEKEQDIGKPPTEG
jgi:hypothetical protein